MTDHIIVSKECEFTLKTGNNVVGFIFSLHFNFHILLLYKILSDIHSSQTAITSFSSLLTSTSDWAFSVGSNFFPLF